MSPYSRCNSKPEPLAISGKRHEQEFSPKRFIQISILTAIVVGVATIGGTGAAYAYVENNNVSDRIARARRLSDEGSHLDDEL